MGGQLHGKVVWVTGAGRGLGRAYAEALAREGAAVALSDITGTDQAVAAKTTPGAGDPDDLAMQLPAHAAPP